MIAIIDYGAGNLQSVQNTLAEIGAQFRLARTPEDLATAPKIILPGVGHFGQLIRSLDAMGLRQPICDRIAAGVPYLGICLGMQALFSGSEEAPELQGLGLMPGTVKRFAHHLRVPHMGWNEVRADPRTRLLRNLSGKPYFYFANSYYCPVTEATTATCDYGLPFSAVIEKDNLFAVQFHPEKSGPLGLGIVRNFVEL
ncbi:MAG: imidazole glycerol phosphate synthase subunit HisH [Bryobacteraceae bacterium]|nr:imidazole glycerol phosphate synthase subunit HisH [Bryobacteraceae bacterium]